MRRNLAQADLGLGPVSARNATLAEVTAHVAWIYLALPLIFLNPFVAYLQHHGYGLLQPESLLCMATLTGCGLLLAAISHISPRDLSYPMIVLTLTIFADIAWAERQRLALFQVLDLAPAVAAFLRMMMFPLMLLVIAAITGLVRARLGFIVTVMFGVMLGSSLLLSQSLGVHKASAAIAPPTAAAGPVLPTVVHIVLDEQIGLEGLPPELPSTKSLQADLKAFYREQGFTLFGRAFSHYYITADAIPNMLNGTAYKRRNAHTKSSGDGSRLTVQRNAWFDRLAGLGYRIKVIQTDYLDFCAGPQVQAGDCSTFPSNTLKGLMAVDLGAGDKSILLFENYIQNSFLLRVSARIFDQGVSTELNRADPGLTGHWRWRPRVLTALSAMPLVERLKRELRTAAPGTAYFAHLLLPHHALIYDRDCRTAAKLEDWMNNTDALLEQSLIRNSAAQRAARYDRYFEQVRCTHVKLGEILAALRDSGRFEDAIIIVHGDHGSRISRREPSSSLAAELTDDDIRDNYATHFAVRLPGLLRGYRQDVRSIQALFAEYLLDRPMAAESLDVYLNQPLGGAGAALESRPMVGY